MEPKKLVPMVTTGVLGAVWIFLTVRGQTPPPALNQAIVAAVGSIFAGAAIPTKEVPHAQA